MERVLVGPGRGIEPHVLVNRSLLARRIRGQALAGYGKQREVAVEAKPGYCLAAAVVGAVCLALSMVAAAEVGNGGSRQAIARTRGPAGDVASTWASTPGRCGISLR